MLLKMQCLIVPMKQTLNLLNFPMTFAEVGNTIQNQAIQAFQPVLENLTQMTANSGFKEALDNIGVVFQGLAAVARVAISGISGSI